AGSGAPVVACDLQGCFLLHNQIGQGCSFPRTRILNLFFIAVAGKQGLIAASLLDGSQLFRLTLLALLFGKPLLLCRWRRHNFTLKRPSVIEFTHGAISAFGNGTIGGDGTAAG